MLSEPLRCRGDGAVWSHPKEQPDAQDDDERARGLDH